MQDRQCRICLDEEDKDFIAPCKCKGSIKFVHRECLDSWRASNANPRAFHECNQCKFKYVIEEIVDDPAKERQRLKQYKMYLMRDSILFIGINMLTIFLMSWLVYSIDQSELIYSSFYSGHNYKILKYLLIGVLSYLALIGIIGLVILLFKGNTGNCNCNNHNCHQCCRSGAGGKGTLVCFAMFVILGIFFAIYIGGYFFADRAQKHKEKLWKYQEAKKYIVKNFFNREHEM